MFTLMPSHRSASITGRPSTVPGILIIRFGRSTAAQSRRASAVDADALRARWGDTSRLTNPSAPSVASYTGRSTSQARRTSVVTRRS